MGCGYIMNENKSFPALASLLLCNFTGVMIIYRLNDCLDSTKSLIQNIKAIIQTPFHQITLLIFLISAPFAFFALNEVSLTFLIVSAILGFFYTVQIKTGAKNIRLKNIFLVKNLLIGIGWGNLVIIGAGQTSPALVMGMYAFVCVQVFIGSMIRDIADVNQDHYLKIKSFPVVIGVSNSIMFMHMLNLLTGIFLFLSFSINSFLIIVSVTTLWRAINLLFLKQHSNSVFWSQTVNLLTCLLMVLLSAITIKL